MKKIATKSAPIIGKIIFILLISQLIRCTKPECDKDCTSAPSGLVSWWPGDGNANDIVGSNNGTLKGGVTFANGKVGKAFSFNGTNYMEAPTFNLPAGNSNRTMMLWVKINSFNPAGEGFLAYYGVAKVPGAAYGLGTVYADSTLFFSQWGLIVLGPQIHTNRWYHVAVTNIGNDATLYLDGINVGSGNLPINTASGGKFYIGKVPIFVDYTRELNGLIDEVQIYNRALDASEIKSIFNAGSKGLCKEGNNSNKDYSLQ